jgi:hypothetical protein
VAHRAISKLLEFVGIQREVNLIEHNGLGALAGGLQHEVRTVFTQQVSGVIDEVTLLWQSAQIDGGGTHGETPRVNTTDTQMVATRVAVVNTSWIGQIV